MSIYDFIFDRIDGQIQSLSDYKGKVLVIVNTASKCGFTPQYRGLQVLYDEYRESGLEILGFPCDQFGHQDPGSNEDIQQFCELRYKVTFPMFAKINVNGDNAEPLYTYLKREAPGALGTHAIKWNFTKFLVGRDGTVVKRFAPSTEPNAMATDIERELNS